MSDTQDVTDAVRALIVSLPDDAIRRAVDAVVRGIVQGIADEVADRAVETIIDRLHDAAAAAPLVDDDPTPPPSVQDAVRRTCTLCGRVGTRRFTQTPGGWQCSPTAKCSGRTVQAAKPAPPPAPPVAKAAPPLANPTPPGVTARCQDCTRAWNLTGRVLEVAVQTHEVKHGHIVTIFGELI